MHFNCMVNIDRMYHKCIGNIQICINTMSAWLIYSYIIGITSAWLIYKYKQYMTYMSA